MLRLGKVDKDIHYMSALEEQGHFIAQAGRGTKDDKMTEAMPTVRFNGEYEVVEKDKVSLMDVSPSPARVDRGVFDSIFGK